MQAFEGENSIQTEVPMTALHKIHTATFSSAQTEVEAETKGMSLFHGDGVELYSSGSAPEMTSCWSGYRLQSRDIESHTPQERFFHVDSVGMHIKTINGSMGRKKRICCT